MKKHAVSLLMIICIFVLFGCGQNSTDYGSQKGQSCAKQAIEAITSYCNGTFTYERTKNTLDKLYEDMDYVSESSDEDKNPNHLADFGIQVSILQAGHDLLMDNYDNDANSYQELQNDIDELQKYIDE